MKTEIIRTLLGYAFAFAVFLYGGWFFYTGYLDINAPALPPEADAFSVALVGFMGMALQWVFGTATQAATARQTTAALNAPPPGGLNPYPTNTQTGQPLDPATGGYVYPEEAP